MNKLILRELNHKDQDSFEKAFQNFPKEQGFEFVPAKLYSPDVNFLDFLESLENQKIGKNLPLGFVSNSMLFAFNDNQEIVGRSSIRHSLNEFLFRVGGHIGYGVLPHYRKMGYASEILRQSVLYCRDTLKLSQMLVTCDDDNVGSIKTIEKNGGVLENKISEPGALVLKRRYWLRDF